MCVCEKEREGYAFMLISAYFRVRVCLGQLVLPRSRLTALQECPLHTVQLSVSYKENKVEGREGWREEEFEI